MTAWSHSTEGQRVLVGLILGTKTRTRNRQTYNIELERDLDMQTAWNYKRTAYSK